MFDTNAVISPISSVLLQRGLPLLMRWFHVYAMLATLSVSLTPSLAFPTFNVYQADPKAGGNSSSDTV